MEVKIENGMIEQAINDAASKAIANALGGYNVTSAIANVVTEQIAEGVIAKAISNAVESLDTEDLVQHLAEEIQKATVRATISVLHEGIMSTICKLRGIGDYSEDDKKERERLKVKLFG